MLFKISNQNWIKFAQSAGLGEVLTINRVTDATSIIEHDDLGIASNTVQLKTKHPLRNKHDTYTFNLFGLANAKINGEKILNEDNEFYMLSRFGKAPSITQALTEFLFLTNGDQYYQLLSDYNQVIMERAEKEIEENLEIIKKLKEVKASKEEKEEIRKELNNQVKELRIAMIHRQETTNKIHELATFNPTKTDKKQSPTITFMSEKQVEFQS